MKAIDIGEDRKSCELCMFNLEWYDCDDVKCTADERGDGRDVYFIQSDHIWGGEVWMEGFAITGNRAAASLIRKFDPKEYTFDQAMDSLSAQGLTQAVKGKDGVWRDWGCRFFNNEKDARESFG